MLTEERAHTRRFSPKEERVEVRLINLPCVQPARLLGLVRSVEPVESQDMSASGQHIAYILTTLADPKQTFKL